MKLNKLKVQLDNGESIIIPMNRVDEYTYTNARHISFIDDMPDYAREQLREMYDKDTLICDTLELKINYVNKDDINPELSNDGSFLGSYHTNAKPNKTLDTNPHILGQLLNPMITCIEEIDMYNLEPPLTKERGFLSTEVY